MLSLSVYFISIAYFFLLIEIGPTLNLSLINLSRLIVQVRQDKVRGRFTAVIDNLQMTANFLIQPSFIKGPYIYDVHTEEGSGDLNICHIFDDSIVFKQ